MASTSPPAIRRKLLPDLLIVAALVLIGFLGYRYAPQLTPKSDVTLPPSDCNLNLGPCMIRLPDGGQLEFAIDPRPIPALKPLKLLALAHDLDVARIEVDFNGVDMKMGFNRPQLESIGDGRFTGQASLPVCITGTMQWDATVIVETKRAVVAAPFRFEVGSH